MSYTVLDYYYAGRPIPSQKYRPANGTPLQMYLYGRQVTSLTQNLDKWAETSVNPFGARTTEFFNWGINERLRELRSSIDRGIPVPLGLKGSEGNLSHDHQVLAIGYDTGRYKGDLGNYKEDLKIFVCDPNWPAEIVTLVPNPTAKEYFYLEHRENHWRTYFVDGKYARMAPPNIVNPSYPADGLVHELLLEFVTGPDDMRGGADHVDLTLKLSDNTSQAYPNISQNGRWLPDYLETVQVVLRQPIRPELIRTLEISTNAGGGLSGDNWDMDSVLVTAVGGGFTRDLISKRAGPYRFTGARTPFVVTLNASPAPPSPSEDCIPFNPVNLKVQHSGANYLLVDGSTSLVSFATQADADRAIAEIRKHGFRRQCFVGRPFLAGHGMTYFLP